MVPGGQCAPCHLLGYPCLFNAVARSPNPSASVVERKADHNGTYLGSLAARSEQGQSPQGCSVRAGPLGASRSQKSDSFRTRFPDGDQHDIPGALEIRSITDLINRPAPFFEQLAVSSNGCSPTRCAAPRVCCSRAVVGVCRWRWSNIESPGESEEPRGTRTITLRISAMEPESGDFKPFSFAASLPPRVST